MKKRLLNLDLMMTFRSLPIFMIGLFLAACIQNPSNANAIGCQDTDTPPKATRPGDADEEHDKKSDSHETKPEESGRKESEEKKTEDNNSGDKKQDDKEESKEQPKQDDESKPKNSEDEEKSEREGPRFPFGMGGGDTHKAKSRRSSEMNTLFKPLIASAEASTVRVLDNERQVSLGTVISRDGLILTKASELKGDLKCGLADGRKLPATVVGVHAETDLALIRIETNDLHPINWGTDGAPAVGQWVVSPVRSKNAEMQIGVVGVKERRIHASSPFIGIRPAMTGESENDGGAKIASVSENAPGFAAGIKVGDIVTKIDDVEIKNWDTLRNTLKQYDPGDEVTLTINRDSKDVIIKVVLGDREKLEARASGMQPDRSTMQNNMGSQPSQRRKDFPMAFTHDLMLNKTTVGGPIVNLNGQVVGINIARAGRVDSLALPTNTILPVIEILKSGELAPSKVNQARLEKIDSELAEAADKLKKLPDEKVVETKRDIEKARKEELERARKEMEKALTELQNRIKDVDSKKENLEKELKAKKDLLKKKNNLEKEKKNLSTGIN